MKNLLGTLVVLLSISIAQASVSYDQYYTDSSGKRVQAADALISSVRGETIYKCQTVESKVSKSGTSIGIHAIKKPKVSVN